MAKVKKVRVAPSPMKRDDTGQAVTKYRAEYAEQVYPLALAGMTYDQMGVVLGGVKGATLSEWAKKYPAFKAALLRGLAGVAGDAAGVLHKRMIGGQKVTTEHQLVTKKGHRVVSRTVQELPPDPRAAETILKAKLPAVWGAPGGGGGSQVNVQVNNRLGIETQCNCNPRPGEDYQTFLDRKHEETEAVRKKLFDRIEQISVRIIAHETWKVEDVIAALDKVELPPDLHHQICDMVRDYRLEEERGTPLTPTEPAIPNAPYHAPQDAAFTDVKQRRSGSLITLTRN